MDVSNEVVFQGLVLLQTVDTINSMGYTSDMKLAPSVIMRVYVQNAAWLYVSLYFLLLIKYRKSSATATNTPCFCL
jgi:hypothetical protein